jgi:hypothetical protein
LKIAKAAQVIGAKVVWFCLRVRIVVFDPDVRIEMPADIPELLSPVFYMVPYGRLLIILVCWATACILTGCQWINRNLSLLFPT